MGEKKELRRRTDAWNDAWNSRDPAALPGFFAKGSTYFEPSLPRPMPGKQGVAAAARKTWAEWPEVTFEEVSRTIDSPRVVIEWRGMARHKSGKKVELQGVDVLEWKGDKLASARVYYDVRGRERALGKGKG